MRRRLLVTVRPDGPVRLVDASAATLTEYFALLLNMSAFNGTCRRIVGDAVSYTHLTLPTNREV